VEKCHILKVKYEFQKDGKEVCFLTNGYEIKIEIAKGSYLSEILKAK
jgi:hypothetical protein